MDRQFPLSPRLLEIFVVESENTAGKPQSQSQVFILRCEACSKESRYLKAEIENFEGAAPKLGELNACDPMLDHSIACVVLVAMG